jgi:MFS family permease
VASVIGGLAPTAPVLVAARGLQGIGAAICAPTALALLTALFAEGRERSRALAIWSVIGSFGLVAGAILGGLVTAGLGWRWILLLNAPVAVVGIAFLLATIDTKGTSTTRPHFDIAGALVVTTGVATLIYAATQLEQAGLGSAQTLASLGAALLLLAAFPLIELRVAAPLLPLPLLRRGSLVGANITAFLLNGGFGGALFLTTLHLQQLLHFSALQTGLAFVPLALATVVGGSLGSRLTTLLSPRRAAMSGLSVMAGGMAALAIASADGTYLTDVLPGTVAVGLGVSAAYVPITVVAVDRVAPAAEGLASGLYQTIGQIGGALLVAVLAVSAGAVTASDLGDGAVSEAALDAGLSFAFLLGSVLLALGVLTAHVLIEAVPRTRPRQRRE